MRRTAISSVRSPESSLALLADHSRIVIPPDLLDVPRRLDTWAHIVRGFAGFSFLESAPIFG